MPKILRKGVVFRRLSWIAAKYKLPYHRSLDVMSDETLLFINNQSPDLIITLFHQIIKKKLIEIPRLGIINIHPGILPEFKGIQPYFWELMTNFKRAGATLHFISDESIDTGEILGQASYATWSNMSVQLNYYLTILSAAHLLPKVVLLLEQNKLSPMSQDSTAGAYYKWPDSESINNLLKNGHKVFCYRDLKDILFGRYDNFLPEEEKIYKV